MATQAIPATDAKSIAEEGFVFGLPLVYIAQQADVMTNVSKPEGGRAPFISSTITATFPTRKATRSSG
jgi:hypothetical protein